MGGLHGNLQIIDALYVILRTSNARVVRNS